MLALSDLAHLVFHVMTYGEECFLQLPVVDLSQEIRLILHWIRTCTKPLQALLVYLRLGIMACSDEIVVLATLLVEGAKLDETVAHHVRIGGQTCSHLIHRVLGHLIPILLMAVDHLELAAILMRYSRRHLEILLAGTVPLLLFLRTYLNIEAVWMQAEACQFVHHDTAVDTPREQYCYPFILEFFKHWSFYLS